MFEKKNEPLLSSFGFMKRMAFCFTISLLLMVVSVLIGMVGYSLFEEMDSLNAFHQAAVIYSGVGTCPPAVSAAGKIFEGLYALFGAVALFAPITVLIAPVVHRFMHKYGLGK